MQGIEFLSQYVPEGMIAPFIMFSAVGSVLLFRLWGKSKGTTSEHATDTSLNDIALTKIGSMFESRDTSVLNGAQVWRPTWGGRLIVPGILCLFAFTFDFERFMVGMDTSDRQISLALIWAAKLFLLFHWVMALLVHSVRIDGTQITSRGFSLRPQSRDLAGVQDIRMNKQSGLYELHFTTERPLPIPRHLSRRAELISLIEDHIHRNQRLTA